MIKIKTFAIALGALSLSALALPAAAECSSGFLANLACNAGFIDQNTAQTLDAINARGKFAEQGAAAAAGAVFGPQVGAAVAGGFQAQQNGGFPGAPFPGPSVQTPFPGGGMAIGAFCAVNGGRYGPGPIQPVGASCAIGTPMGPIFGQIVP